MAFIINARIAMIYLVAVILLAIALVFSFITLTPWGRKLDNKVFAEHYSKRLSWVMFALTLMLLVLSLGALCVSNFNPFIYFRF